ncbi:MAG TPA: 2-oxoacid:acceptor oxidoreductase family protein, partial [Anaerolineales bacterium]
CVQETQDFAAIAQAATLKTRVPFLHFFDGFRTSHEVTKIFQLTDEELRSLLDDELIRAHRARALSPEHPVLRGSAQNPDVYFQMREAVNPYYTAVPAITQEAMDKFAQVTGRQYKLFDYYGDPNAERVVVVMGSGGETVVETVKYLASKGEKVGAVLVRLYRPFSVEHFIKALPKSVKSVAVLDRTKEPGASGEPLYLDIVNALVEGGRTDIKTIGGRYGLSSKEFTPAVVKAVLDELCKDEPKNHFTVGINDDVAHTSLDFDPSFMIEPEGVVSCVFFGLGADGTVGANKNSIKIIGEETDNFAQGYFVYDSKKSGATTVSHLRFGPRPIRSSYLIKKASFVACHQFEFLDRIDVLERAARGAVFLLNAPYPPEQVWDRLPREVQDTIVDRELRLFSIDAQQVGRDTGMGGRINTIMQVCFFAISGVLPREEAIARIKEAIEKTYGKRGAEIVKRNFAAVDATLSHLHSVPIPPAATATRFRPPLVAKEAPDFVQRVTAVMMAGKGDALPVSAFPVDGTWPLSTTRWEKRNLADRIPVWDPKVCIQCNQCAFVCPHAAIRAKRYPAEALAGAP